MTTMPPFESSDLPQLQHARSLWSSGDAAQALTRFAQAVSEHPRNVRALVEAARAMGQRYEVARAEAWLQRAEQLAGNDPLFGPLIAQSYRYIHRPHRALELLAACHAARQLSPPQMAELAVLYEQTHQLEQARSAIEACMAAAPEQLEPQLIVARLDRAQGAHEAARRRLEQLSVQRDAPPILTIRAWNELAHLRDAEGDYAGAIEALERSKELMRAAPAAEQAIARARQLNGLLRDAYARLSTSRDARWDEAIDRVDSDPAGLIHLLSFPRTGSTLLEQMLDAHPQMVAVSEQPIFRREIMASLWDTNRQGAGLFEKLEQLDAEQRQGLRQRYFAMMNAMVGSPWHGRWLIDKNPNHTSLIAGLWRLFPESRYIFTLRDPRDIVVSAYFRYFPLSEFSSMMLSWSTMCEQFEHEIGVLDAVREPLRERSLEVRYESIVNEPRATLRQVIEWLGVSWDDAVLDYRSSKERKVIVSPSQSAVRESIHQRSIGRWRHYESYLRPYLDRLIPYCRRWGYDT